MRLLVILGNQLFPLENVKALSIDAIFMVEDAFLCSHFRYHQQKLVMILTAMRSYAQLLRDNGFLVHYRALDEAASMREQAAQSAPLPVDETDFVRCLDAFVDAAQVTDLIYFEVEGKAMQQRLNELVQRKKLLSTEVTSPMFLTERAQFQHFLGDARKPQMATFYRQQRRRLKVLLTALKTHRSACPNHPISGAVLNAISLQAAIGNKQLDITDRHKSLQSSVKPLAVGLNI